MATKSTKTTTKKPVKKKSTAKKATTEARAVKTEPVESVEKVKAVENTEEKKTKENPYKPVLVGILIVLVLILVAGWINKDKFVVAWVNGKPITNSEYVKEMHKQVGQNTLDALVIQALILQEADTQGVSVEQSDIDAELKQIEDQYVQEGQTLDSLLAVDGMTRDDLEKQIRMQKIVEVLSSQDVEVSDDEVAGFLDSNKDFLPEGMSDEELSELAREQIASQSQQAQVQTWIDGLKAKAAINYWAQHQEALPISAPTQE